MQYECIYQKVHFIYPNTEYLEGSALFYNVLLFVKNFKQMYYVLTSATDGLL